MEGHRGWLLLLVLLALSGWSSGLQITKIGVPHVVMSGKRVSLTCFFEVGPGDEVLYSLTWWKDDSMFFSFQPKNVSPISVSDTPGISVDIGESSLHEVILSKVDHRASGRLRCEVIADRPFSRDTKDRNMTVVDLPRHDPLITGRREGYQVGDLLLMNCSAPFSYPPTTLTWEINGKKASQETVIVYPGENDGEGREASWSGLQMWLQANHFRDGVLVLHCTAAILNVYRVSTHVDITDANYIQSSPREGASTGGVTTPGLCRVVVLLLLFLLLGVTAT